MPKIKLPRIILIGFLLSVAASANGKAPAWTDQPPTPDAHFVYAVGAGTAKTLAGAERIAVTDALGKLAAEVGVTVTARSIDTMSSRDGDNNILVETRSSARGLVRDAEPVERPWVEVARSGGLWPFKRRATYTVHVLLRWSQASLKRERQRQASAWQDYRASLDQLARSIGTAVDKARLPHKIAIGSFVEATTRKPYAFTRVLKRDVGDALVRAGLVVVPAPEAPIAVVGTYRAVGAEVVVTAQVYRLSTRENIGVADIAVDRAMIEPAWLESPSPIEPTFEALEPERADTSARIGAISLVSQPTVAQIFIDGDSRGKTPAVFGAVPVGERAVTIIAEGFEPFQDRVQVQEGETTTVNAVLQPKVGSLEIRSRPIGADVISKGQRLGKTPLKLRDLAVGSYTLTLRLNEYQDAEVSSEVRSRETTVADVALVERPGNLFIISDPSGATIFLDGVRVGKAAAPNFLKVEHVAVGRHELAASKDGSGVWSGAVMVQALKTATINAKLRNNLGVLSITVAPAAESIQIVGAGSSVSLTSRTATCDSSSPCSLAVPLKEGDYSLLIAASGYESEERAVRVVAGREQGLAVALTAGDPAIKNGTAAHVFGRLMPIMKGTLVDGFKRDDINPVAHVLATCILSPLIAVGLAVDVVGLPVHIPDALATPRPSRKATEIKPPDGPLEGRALVAQQGQPKSVANMNATELDQWLHRRASH